jgi:hypothetical protein
MYVQNVTGSLHIFNPNKKVFSASLAHNQIFSSQRFYFSTSHANSPIVGASDTGQLSTLTSNPKELPPGTSKGPLHLAWIKEV